MHCPKKPERLNKDVTLKSKLPSYNQYHNMFGRIGEEFPLTEKKRTLERQNETHKRAGSHIIGGLNSGLNDIDLANLSFHNSGKPVFGREW